MNNTLLKWRWITTAVVFILSMVAISPADAQGLGCHPADTTSQRILRYVKGLAATPTPARDSLGLTSVDTAAITLVTDSLVCGTVARVADSAFSVVPERAYIVIRAGARYVCYDPGTPEQPGIFLTFLDQNYAYKTTIVAF